MTTRDVSNNAVNHFNTPGPSVLLAEDDVPLQQLCFLWLTRSGYKVHVVGDGREALESLQNGAFDLLITDHQMPGCTGVQLISQLRRAGQNIPVILTSGSSEAEEECNQTGTSGWVFLPKPYKAAVLLALAQMMCSPSQPKVEFAH